MKSNVIIISLTTSKHSQHSDASVERLYFNGYKYYRDTHPYHRFSHASLLRVQRAQLALLERAS